VRFFIDESSHLQTLNIGPEPRHDHGGTITARIDRLPACRATWQPMWLASLACIFEMYELFETAYIPAGLIRSGIFHGNAGWFGLSDQASFAAATFIGLFIGTAGMSALADRAGRRVVFLYALLGYSLASVLVAMQSTVLGINLFRLLAGAMIGLEMVTVDSYLVEVMPAPIRGRAFALMHAIMFLGTPLVALFAWLLIPIDPFGIAGWRWVVLIGSAGALLVWWLRRGLAESPRWLAQHGREAEAEAQLGQLERRVEAQTGKALPPPLPALQEAPHRSSFRALWRKPYGRRTTMLLVFNFFQTIGFFGFANWLPALVASRGHSVTQSLFYSFCIAIAYPVTPLLWSVTVAERFERKWLIVAAALGVALAGPLFAVTSNPVVLVFLGVLITAFTLLMSLAFHPYQAELYPTAIRARAVGFVYSFSRISTALTGFLIAFCLQRWGTIGVFVLISFSMAMVILSIGCFGPRTRARSLEEIALDTR
jgi:putative MFS transporter